MLSLTTPIPESLERYPRVDGAELVALQQWLRSLPKRHLIMLLSDRDIEPKLVALKCDELAAEAEPVQADTAMMAGGLVCAAIAIGIAAVAFLPI